MRKWTKVAATSVAAIAGAAVLAAFALPGREEVARSIDVAASPARVFELVNSPKGFDSFNPFRVADPKLETSYGGPASGPGATLHWSGKQGKGSQTIVASETNSRVDMALDLGPMGKPSQSFLIEPTATGARVTWRTEATFGPNPIARAFGLGMGGMLGPVYERGLNDLKTLAETNA